MIRRCILALLCILALALPAAAAEPAGRKLTLMVYMCGSNLESGHGAASADIEEMKAAVPAGRDVTILIMTGGTFQWSQGYDPSQCLIHEIGPRGTRIVWRSEALNMGEPDTLTQLLRFGQDSYPAEDYALILWNHGGGPMEGVCWDELFSLDQLTLAELTDGIRQAELPQKLSWIGFDACLMGSLEVAQTLSPYAEYMIASQETEPAMGWNYAFLRGLPEDPDGAATGRRVIDAYFENETKPGETLTLSCLDLSKADAAAQAVGRYFRNKPVDTATLDRISAIRGMAVSYGAGVRGTGGYDLVDLTDLMRCMDDGEAGADVSGALDSLVVYSRSNRENAGGLSIYFPSENKTSFSDRWRGQYQALHFSDDYFAYISAFGSYLLEEDPVDWSGITASYEGVDEALSHHLTLQMTPEQAAQALSVELIILQEIDASVIGTYDFAMIGREKAVPDGVGTYRAVYRNRSIWAQEDGSEDGIGPITFYTTRQSSDYAVAAIYTTDTQGLDGGEQVVFYYLDSAADGTEVPVTQIRVSDEVTDYTTNRIAFTEDGYDHVMFWTLQRQLRLTEDDGQPLPGFSDWPSGGRGIRASGFRLPRAWHFEYQNAPLGGMQLWAVFEVTDLRRNTYCTRPLPLRQPYLSEPALGEETYETDDWRITASAVTDANPGDSSLRVIFDVENKSGQEAEYHFAKLSLNGRRNTRALGSSVTVPAGQHGQCVIQVDVQDLYDMTDLRQVAASFDIRINREKIGEDRTLEYTVPALDLSVIAPPQAPLAAARSGPVRVDLLELTETAHGVEALLYVENGGETAFSLSDRLILNGDVQINPTGRKEVPAGKEQLMELGIRWDNDFDSIQLGEFSSGGNETYRNYYISDGRGLVRDGITGLTLVPDGSAPMDLQLESAWALQESAPAAPFSIWGNIELLSPELLSSARGLTLTKDDRVEVGLDWIIVTGQSVALRVAWRNLTDEPVKLSAADFTVNGTVEARMGALSHEEVTLEPHAVLRDMLYLTFPDRTDSLALEELSFRLTLGKQAAEAPCVIRLDAPAQATGDLPLVLDGGAARTEPVSFEPEKPEPPKDENPTFYLAEIPLPEDPAGYERWIEAPLTEAQRKAFASGMVFIVRETDPGIYEILSMLRLARGREGTVGAAASGLLVCMADDPEMILRTGDEARADDGWRAVLTPTMWVFNQDFEVFTVDTIRYSFKTDAEAAMITEIQTGEPGYPASQLDFAQVVPFEIVSPYAEGQETPFYDGFEVVNDFMRALNAPAVTLEGRSIRFAFRPLSDLEGVKVIFCCEDGSGKGYTLPLCGLEEVSTALAR